MLLVTHCLVKGVHFSPFASYLNASYLVSSPHVLPKVLPWWLPSVFRRLCAVVVVVVIVLCNSC